MQLQYLTSDDWQEFQRRFPSAEAFLLHRSLIGEVKWLQFEIARPAYPEEAGRRRWITERLKELENGLYYNTQIAP
jgi:hypothetical protein